MTRPIQPSNKNKRLYAYAILSGLMTRKDAYTKYINPCCMTPTKSATQLHKTKKMQLLLAEVSKEIEDTITIKKITKDITNKQLTLAQALLDDAKNKTYTEKLALLKAIKPVQDNALATLKRLDDSYNLNNDSCGSRHNQLTAPHHTSASKYIN